MVRLSDNVMRYVLIKEDHGQTQGENSPSQVVCGHTYPDLMKLLSSSKNHNIGRNTLKMMDCAPISFVPSTSAKPLPLSALAIAKILGA